MANTTITDQEVEQEIARLSQSPFVKLARREQQLKYKRRQRMYALRWLEKHGKELAAKGITMEDLDGALADIDIPDYDE